MSYPGQQWQQPYGNQPQGTGQSGPDFAMPGYQPVPTYQQPQPPQQPYYHTPQPPAGSYAMDVYRSSHYPSPSQAYDAYGQQIMPEQKSKLVTILLAVFFGYLGVHNFYVGNTQVGVAQIVTFAISTLLMIVLIGVLGYIALAVWVFVDIILAATGSGYMSYDSNGYPLK